MKQALVSKLTSRKFITCIAGFILGVCMMFNLDQTTVNSVAGAIVSLGSVISYIIAEGKIDANRVKDTIDDVAEAVDAVKGTND